MKKKSKVEWLEIVGKECGMCHSKLLIRPFGSSDGDLCWNACEKCNRRWIGWNLLEVPTRPRGQLNLFDAGGGELQSPLNR